MIFKVKSNKMYIVARPSTPYKTPVPIWTFRIKYYSERGYTYLFASKDLQKAVDFRNKWLQKNDKKRWERVKEKEGELIDSALGAEVSIKKDKKERFCGWTDYMYIYARPNSCYGIPKPSWSFRIKHNNKRFSYIFGSTDLQKVLKFRNEWLQIHDLKRWAKVKKKEGIYENKG